MAGFHATPSRRITVLYSIIVYVIRFKAHHYIDNRRYENDGLGRIGVSSQTSRVLFTYAFRQVLYKVELRQTCSNPETNTNS